MGLVLIRTATPAFQIGRPKTVWLYETVEAPLTAFSSLKRRSSGAAEGLALTAAAKLPVALDLSSKRSLTSRRYCSASARGVIAAVGPTAARSTAAGR